MIGVLLRAWRESERRGVREAAKMIGVSHSTLSRIERGEAYDNTTMLKLLLWLDSDGRRQQLSYPQRNPTPEN
jgi:transcriptional regulator with XRE-family HTH domain